MYQNSFSVNVEGGQERESGYVELRHGTKYALKLRNERSVPCDAMVEIDGKEVGAYRIEPHTTIRVERPANEAKRFTFYRADTEESEKSGQSGVMFEERGLIKVTFNPGVAKTKVIKTLQNVRSHWNPDERSRRSFKDLPLCCDSGEECWELSDGELGSASGERSRGGQQLNSTIKRKGVPLSYKAEGFMDAVAPASASDIMRGTGDYIGGKAERKSGITGLSGSSGQRFDKTASLPEYDEAYITEINLRLVAIEDEREDPTPLRPITRKTPIPPPVYLI